MVLKLLLSGVALALIWISESFKIEMCSKEAQKMQEASRKDFSRFLTFTQILATNSNLKVIREKLWLYRS